MAALDDTNRAELEQVIKKSEIHPDQLAVRLCEGDIINESTLEDVRSRTSFTEKVETLTDAVTKLGITAYENCCALIKNIEVEVSQATDKGHPDDRASFSTADLSCETVSPSFGQLCGDMNLNLIHVAEQNPNYYCPVMKDILFDPYQTTCCGNPISQMAFLNLSKSTSACPLCRSSEFSAFQDTPFQKKIRKLKVRCQYGDHGCRWEGCLDDLLKHNEELQDYHDTLKKIRSIAPEEFILSGFEDFKKSWKMWFSPSFYTRPNGYRMCLRVDVEDNGHLSVYAYLMKGVYDDLLPFPFRGIVTVQLINQDKPHQCDIVFDESIDPKHTTRVVGEERQVIGFGNSKFIPIHKLHNYLEHDSLMFRVMVMTSSIKGVTVTAERTIQTRPAQSVDWSEYGFKLDIPEGVTLLHTGPNTPSLTITVSVEGAYSFLNNEYLVSAVYWLSPSMKFSGPVRIGIEHCASMSKDCDLCFVTAHCTQASLPYKFKRVLGGEFSPDSTYGYLSTHHFSGFAICIFPCSNSRPIYQATLYCEKEALVHRKHYSCKMHFVVTHHLSVLQNGRNDRKKWRKVASLEFEFKEDEITVDWPETLPVGLMITSITRPAKIEKQSIGIGSSSSFEFTIMWPFKPFVSEVKLDVTGTHTAAGKDYITMCTPPFQDMTYVDLAPFECTMENPIQATNLHTGQALSVSQQEESSLGPSEMIHKGMSQYSCEEYTVCIGTPQQEKYNMESNPHGKAIVTDRQLQLSIAMSAQGDEGTMHGATQDLNPEVFIDGRGIEHKRYKMKSSPHGIALVISNTKFSEQTRLSSRASALVDEDKAKAIFEALHYTVVLLRDLTAAQMVEAFRLVVGKKRLDLLCQKVQNFWGEHGYNGTSVSKDNDSFVCCLMSHGGRGVVYGIDKNAFGIELDNFSILLGPKACPDLVGKPKMAFIQCCQGENTAVPVPLVIESDGLDHSPEQVKVTITETSDLCISYASVPGEKSYRSTYPDPDEHSKNGGAWYIHALYDIIKNKKESIRSVNVQSLITMVNCKVTEKQEVDKDKKVLKQCPVFQSTLRYDVYF